MRNNAVDKKQPQRHKDAASQFLRLPELSQIPEHDEGWSAGEIPRLQGHSLLSGPPLSIGGSGNLATGLRNSLTCLCGSRIDCESVLLAHLSAPEQLNWPLGAHKSRRTKSRLVVVPRRQFLLKHREVHHLVLDTAEAGKSAEFWLAAQEWRLAPLKSETLSFPRTGMLPLGPATCCCPATGTVATGNAFAWPTRTRRWTERVEIHRKSFESGTHDSGCTAPRQEKVAKKAILWYNKRISMPSFRHQTSSLLLAGLVCILCITPAERCNAQNRAQQVTYVTRSEA